MRIRLMKGSLLCFVSLACLCVCVTSEAYYVPTGVALKGLGGAHADAVGMDLSTLEQASLLFFSDEAEAAATLQGGNHISLLAKYTDVPAKFDDPGTYSFYAVNGAWWTGIAVMNNEGRTQLASAAANHGFYGSDSLDTPPVGVYSSNNLVVWKQVR